MADQSVLNFMQAQNVRLENLNMADNKLYIRAEAPSQDLKNRVWDQIKLVDSTFSDLTADIEAPAAAASAGGRLPPGARIWCSRETASRRSAGSSTAMRTNT